jgi:hypothetical protein
VQTGDRVECVEQLEAWNGDDAIPFDIGDIGVVVKFSDDKGALIRWANGIKRWVAPSDVKKVRSREARSRRFKCIQQQIEKFEKCVPKYSTCLPPLSRVKPRLPRSVPRFFKNIGNRDLQVFPNVLLEEPDTPDGEQEDTLVLIAYHENGVTFQGMGLIVMKLAFYLGKRDAEYVWTRALKIQAPQHGQLEEVLDETKFNEDVTQILRECNLMPVLRVVPESKWSSKEGMRFSPVPGFRAFVDDLKNKVINYDPRSKPTEKDFYDPDWASSIREVATRGINSMMECVPDDLQQGMILDIDVRQPRETPSRSQNVLVHVDRTHMRGKASRYPIEPGNETSVLCIEGEDAADFTKMWKQIWLQDYTHHAAIGSTRGLATKGWMPMQLRGLRESFAQILTATWKELFSEALQPELSISLNFSRRSLSLSLDAIEAGPPTMAKVARKGLPGTVADGTKRNTFHTPSRLNEDFA